MRGTRYKYGFTLVELLVALIVASIIFTAVATLAYTLGAVNDATNDMAEKQAQVRYATLRISELIRYGKLVRAASDSEISLWLDYNKDEHLDESTELVVIRKVVSENGDMQLCEVQPEPMVLIRQCSYVQFSPDVSPPSSRLVTISFGLVENGVTRQYQISAALRGWAGHLLDESGNIVNDDD